MNWWDIFKGLVLGFVEGMTEFVPVSSTGHMILVGETILHFTGAKAATFEVVIQLGSILAVVYVFWKRLLSLIGIHTSNPEAEVTEHRGHLTLIHVFLAMLPAVVIGLLLHGYIKELFTAKTVLIGLVAGGMLMIVAEKLKRPVISTHLDEISYKQAFTIGCFQCLALWPGFSRSGATISGGLLSGTNHKTAAEFSFIVAVPMMVAASGLDLYKSWHMLSSTDLPLFVTGFVTAFFVALFAIKFFLKLIARISLTPFAIYRFILAAMMSYVIFF